MKKYLPDAIATAIIAVLLLVCLYPAACWFNRKAAIQSFIERKNLGAAVAEIESLGVNKRDIVGALREPPEVTVRGVALSFLVYFLVISILGRLWKKCSRWAERLINPDKAQQGAQVDR